MRLGDELDALGYRGIADVSRWMGQPYDERYDVNMQKYLDFEIETMHDVFTEITGPNQANTVIDTTGSVIHTGEALCRGLRERSLVVHIKATEDKKKRLYAKYMERPKPVVFERFFSKQPGESNQEALMRSYRELLDHRSILYATYADISIPIHQLFKRMNGHDFLNILRSLLPPA